MDIEYKILDIVNKEVEKAGSLLLSLIKEENIDVYQLIRARAMKSAHERLKTRIEKLINLERYGINYQLMIGMYNGGNFVGGKITAKSKEELYEKASALIEEYYEDLLINEPIRGIQLNSDENTSFFKNNGMIQSKELYNYIIKDLVDEIWEKDMG